MADTFAEVILPFPLRESFTYRIPGTLEKQALTGKRVMVLLGKNRRVTGLILRVHQNAPMGYEVKDIESILDENPVIYPVNLELWRWMSKYYICPPGDILKAALPVGLKKDRYKLKTEAMITLSPEINNPETWEETLGSLNRSIKQKELLIHCAGQTKLFSPGQPPGVLKKELLQSGNFNESILHQLIKKKMLVVLPVPVPRLPQHTNATDGLSQLSEFQHKALSEIKEQFIKKQVVLLHGVSYGGKSEIYIHLINDALNTGKQVLFLLPEIALAPQTEEKLLRVFGRKVGLYHSKMSGAERTETWNNVLNHADHIDGRSQLIVGTRSAIFLPFSNLGMIIVDEEHDHSFKQSEASPRYHARDMAVVLGSQQKCLVLLGSATPSFESYFNAQTGKYGLVVLSRRFGNTPPPDIIVADIRRARKRREMRSILTPELYAEMDNALKAGEQIILFQNRRGYSSFMECSDCGYIQVCVNCDVSLSFHLNQNQLVCHYCGYKIAAPEICPACGSKDLRNRGLGTEKAESEIAGLFPTARISRMDQDTLRASNANIRIKASEQNETDIMIGTQMIFKGPDRKNVSLVGVLNADTLLSFPDFRSYERAFQLLQQISNHPGRGFKQGKIVIQTSHPEHTVIQCIKEQDYHGLFSEQMAERKLFHYPPWYRLIKIFLKHKNAGQLKQSSEWLAGELRNFNLFHVLGPESPVIGKIQQWFIREIWLKVSRDQKFSEVQEVLLDVILSTRHLTGNSGLLIHIDVDPV
jgi:primosomal protein N' (replication factor Y) (superfamily II helicase)